MDKGIVYFDNRQTLKEITRETEEFLEKVIGTGLKLEDVEPPWEVSVSFVTPEEIRNLNRDYRNTDKVTDVLSFPLEEVLPDGTVLLGDVIINTERVAEQAEEYGHSEVRELSYLTVHSLLHLLGYDHEVEQEKEVMRRHEERIMDALGIYREEVQ